MIRCGPLFKWFGSKWQAAKKYPLPLFDRIVEPYAGGAGYALNYCEKDVCIYDNDPNLGKLWSWLINDATHDLVMSIPINLPEGTNILGLDLSFGQKMLLKHWQRTNNVGDCWTISSWGNKPGQWTANTRARIAEDVYKVKHWKFGPVDFSMGKATYFVDPPYVYNYKYRTGKEFDYAGLRDCISNLPNDSQVIVCEAICPKTGRIPDYLPFKYNHSSVTSRRKASNNHHSKEVVFVFP